MQGSNSIQELRDAIAANQRYREYLKDVVLKSIDDRQKQIRSEIQNLKRRRMLSKTIDLSPSNYLAPPIEYYEFQHLLSNKMNMKACRNANMSSQMSVPVLEKYFRDKTSSPAPNADTTYLQSLESSNLLPDYHKYQTIPWRKKATDSLRSAIEQCRRSGMFRCSNPITIYDWELVRARNSFLRENYTAFQLKIRWDENEDPFLSRKVFSKEEEEILLQTLESDPDRDWEYVALAVSEFNHRKGVKAWKRTAVQCLERYQTRLNSKMTKSVWTTEEDEKLKNVVAILGPNDWNTIAECLDGRIANQCYRRWTYSLAPTLRFGRWSVTEDRRLALAAYAYAEEADPSLVEWKLLERHVPGRTDAQIRERWVKSLNPTLTKSKWSPQEDQTLLNLVGLHGVGNWREIAKMLYPRTNDQCYRRWQHLAPEDWKDHRSKLQQKPKQNLHQFKRREARKLEAEDIEK